MLWFVNVYTEGRGYILTGNSSFLAEYTDSKQRLESSFEYLRLSLLDFVDRQAKIRELIATRITTIEEGVKIRQEKGLEAAIQHMTSFPVLHQMELIQNEIGGLQLALRESVDSARKSISSRTYFCCTHTHNFMTGTEKTTYIILAVLGMLDRFVFCVARDEQVC